MNRAQTDESAEIKSYLRFMSENCTAFLEFIKIAESLPDFSQEEINIPDVLLNAVMDCKQPYEYGSDSLEAALLSSLRLAVVVKAGSGYRAYYTPYMLGRYALMRPTGFFEVDNIEILCSLYSQVFHVQLRGVDDEETLKEKALNLSIDDKGIVNKVFQSLLKRKVDRKLAVALFDYCEILNNRILDVVEAIEAQLEDAYSHTAHTLY